MGQCSQYICTTTFSARPEISGQKDCVWGSFGGMVVQYTQNAPPRPILPLFSADGRPCAYVFSTVSVSANMYLDADCC